MSFSCQICELHPLSVQVAVAPPPGPPPLENVLCLSGFSALMCAPPSLTTPMRDEPRRDPRQGVLGAVLSSLLGWWCREGHWHLLPGEEESLA